MYFEFACTETRSKCRESTRGKQMLTAKRNLAELGAIKDVGTETHPILLHGYKISPENVHNSVLPQYFTFSAPLTCGHWRATGVDFCWWYFTEALQLPWLKQSDPRSEQREGSLIHNECIHHSHTMTVSGSGEIALFKLGNCSFDQNNGFSSSCERAAWQQLKPRKLTVKLAERHFATIRHFLHVSLTNTTYIRTFNMTATNEKYNLTEGKWR